MILKIILNHILGYVRIKVEGVFLERFLNICISKKIFIWNVKRHKATMLYANIGIKEFKEIKNIARKTKSHIKIEGKKGLPFIIHKYRRRKVFLILFCIVIFAMITMSNFIWNIDIEGTKNIPDNEILQAVKEQGLKIGVLKHGINTTKIINKIRLEREDISWIGIDIKGTNVIIKIKETKQAPEIIDNSEVCNIIADKTGIITKINVQEGMASVGVGDLVQKGEVLVNGFLDGQYTDRRYVHARAEIEAKIWYSKKKKFYFNEQIPVDTGDVENKYSIKINNFKINFYKTLSKFEKYDTIITKKKIMVFPNFYLPIEIIKKTNKEYKIVDKTYTEAELIEQSTKKLETKILEEIKEQNRISNKQVNTYQEDDGVVIEVIYEVIEKIGIEEKS